MKGQTVIVSGGSRGLGQAIVEHLLRADAAVATFSREESEFIAGTSQREDIRDRFWFAPLDASDAIALRSFVAEVYERFGRIDALVNNAGVAVDGLLAMTSDDAIDAMLTVNLRASLILARECARFMLLAKTGCIVNISSTIGMRGFSGLAAYSATKAGQLGLTRALARELGARGIRVNAIAPGYLETEMSEGLSPTQREQVVRRTPLGRLGQPEDVLPCLDFLLSPASGFVTGQVIVVDGGATV